MLNTVNPLNAQAWLDSKGAGLAQTKLLAEGKWYKAGEWIDEVARRFRIKPEWILTVLQKEQSLAREKSVMPAAFTLVRVKDIPADYVPPTDKNGVTVRYVRSKDGPYRVTGSWRLIAATGAGIPDPKVTPPWDVAVYLGLGNQIYQTAKLTSKWLDQFERAVVEGKPADRTVTLYPTAAEIALANKEGRKPRGENVVAADGPTFVALQYTPSEDAAILAMNSFKSLGFV